MAQHFEHLPAEVTPRDLTLGYQRPGLNVTPMAYGTIISRAWSDRVLRSYTWQPSIMPSTGNGQPFFEAFIKNTGGGLNPFWVTEPQTLYHPELPSGPLGDGTRDTFPVPLSNYGTGSFQGMMVDGVPVAVTTVFTSANTFSDDEALVNNTSAMAITNGSVTSQTGFSRSGNYCGKVTPTGGGAVTAETRWGAVTASTEYTGIVAVFDPLASPRSFSAGLNWYSAESAPSYLGTVASVAAASTSGQWTFFSVTATAHASANYAGVYAYTTSTDTTPFYVDCFAIAGGDYDRWHLPSASPALAKLTSAPASGGRVAAFGVSGKAMALVKVDEPYELELLQAGHSRAQGISMTEVVEVSWL
jgi:hypothetical protein